MLLRTIEGAELRGKRALVRVDFNVPVHDGRVADEDRLKAALPTIAALRAAGARVILMSHFGRPEGERVPSMSLEPLVGPLAELIGAPVAFADDCIGEVPAAAERSLGSGGVLLLENLRFHPGEEANDPEFAKQLAALGDIYVDDAFSAAHRAHASIERIARLLPAYAGESMRRELAALDQVLGHPKRPVLGIVGGAKTSTKLEVLENLLEKLEWLAIFGGIANTFLRAEGWEIGASAVEPNLTDEALKIVEKARFRGCDLILPVDVVVGDTADLGAGARVRRLGEIQQHEQILDIGPVTIERLKSTMDAAKTLIWNGPLGVFETPPFDHGTLAAAEHAAALAKAGKLVAVAGGGDTAAALHAAKLSTDFTFVSTAGGAFLEWLAGKTLPGVAVLEAQS